MGELERKFLSFLVGAFSGGYTFGADGGWFFPVKKPSWYVSW